MKKSPGFWFFTGDWLKDPELRFCSIFARGLLVDLLCYMFEANEQGYLSKPDGTARTDFEIVDAISGGSREEKLAGLAELEASGVISRDLRGVLYSRRIARLAEISQTRQQNGSKGGSKTQANLKQIGKQTNKQKRGVSVSDSVSVSDTFSKEIPPLSPKGDKTRFDASETILPAELDTEAFREAWSLWCKHRVEIKKPLKPTMVSQQLKQFEDWGEIRSITAIRHTIARGWQGIQEPEHRRNGKTVNPEIGDLF
jgi:hypothetical protein